MEKIFQIAEYIMSSSYLIAYIVFTIMSVMAFIFSIIFLFHWRKYGMGGVTLAIMEIVYVVVALLLVGVAFFSI